MRNNNAESENKNRKNIIIKIVILVIIILLLICSCTAVKYFGRIGNRTTEIDKDINNQTELPIIINKNLKFDIDDVAKHSIKLSNGNYKISYSVSGIKLNKLTCVTSDKEIATCYVEDGYVVVIPKAAGEVQIVLESVVNDVRYRATTDLTIVDDSNSNGNKKNAGKNNNKDKIIDNGSTAGGNTPTDPETGDLVVDSDSRLKSLTVGDYDLKPSFNPSVYDYVVTVDSNINKVKIKAKTISNRAKILSGTGNIRLNNTSTIVSIKVEAEDGTTSIYIVKINKKDNPTVLSNDATLKELNVTNYTLNPDFNSNTFNYVIEVGYNIDSLNISAIPNCEYANVIIKDNSGFVTGNNKVEIVVVAEDGTTNTYTITVNKKAKEELPKTVLKDIIINGNSISGFDPTVLTYNYTVDSNTYSLNVDGIPLYDGTTVEVIGNTNFNPGTNTVTIKVTDSHGNENYYNIIVNKERDNTKVLSNLAVKNYSLNETFNENSFNYSVDIPYNINNLEVLYTKKDERETVEITGNTNIPYGESDITVKVIAEDGTYNTYNIKVNRAYDLTNFYIYSLENYTVGYNPNNDNTKTIIINTNVLDGNITVNKTNNSITVMDDNNSKVVLEYDGLDIDYITDESLNSLAFKITYNTAGVKNINVTGIKDNHLIKEYNIIFNIVRQYNLTLDANGGFFTDVSNIYEFVLDADSVFDLSNYGEAYKLVDDTSCLTYKFIGYDTNKDSINPTYDVNNLGNITITADMYLYAIYSTSQTEPYVSTGNRLYLTDIDLFVLEDGTKNFIYPGTEGVYVMKIKNTTSDKITIKTVKLEENNICIDANTCVNMGYKVRYTENNTSIYSYAIGSSTDYNILYKTGTSIESNIENLVLNPGEETELTLFWQWAYSKSHEQDVIDTKIGKYMNDHSNLKYEITVSFTYDKESNQCDN